MASHGGAATRPRMGVFLRVLTAMTVVVHAPFVVAVHALARERGIAHPWWVALIAGALGVFLFVGRARAAMPDRRRSEALRLLVDIPYFVHWCGQVLATLLVVPYLVLGPIVGLLLGRGLSVDDRGVLVIDLAATAICAYGVLLRRGWFVIERHELVIEGLPKAFDGLRIAHLSDLHIGTLTPKRWGDRWVRAANALEPDIAVVTGDLVTSGTDFHADVAELLGALRAPEGIFVAMGNHDYFGNGEPLISLLRARGVEVLRNERRPLLRGAERLDIAAIDDIWTRRADLAKALDGAIAGVVTVLLAHDPSAFPAAAERGVELVLSGHTHGGQLALPFFARRVSLAALAHRHRLGLYRMGSSQLYVSPGLGTTGPPIRLGVAPAVTLLTLRRVPEPDAQVVARVAHG